MCLVLQRMPLQEYNSGRVFCNCYPIILIWRNKSRKIESKSPADITVYQGDRHFSDFSTYCPVKWRVKLYFRWTSCDLTRSRKSFLPPSPPPPTLPDSYHKTCGALWYAKLTRIGHTPFILPNLSLRNHAKRHFIRPFYLHALQFVSDRQTIERSRWLRNYCSENLRTVRENT